MKKLLYLLSICILCGCYNTNIAWRGVIDTTRQTATTEGKINNKPESGNISISAEKQTEIQADVPITK